MVVKVYISGISGNHEIRKRQQRVMFVLSSLKIDFEIIDITEIGKESQREFMREQCKLHNKEKNLPPQIFNEEIYCGDFLDFDIANEEDWLRSFLKLGEKIPTGGGDHVEDIVEKPNLVKMNPSDVDAGETEALEA